MLVAWISPKTKQVTIHALGAPVASSTVEHFLSDQLAPRLVAHEGRLVLHAAMVARDRVGVAIVGRSGAGKSTLSASLGQQGWSLLGDDAMIVEPQLRVAFGKPVYGSLRLFPDSIAALWPNGREGGEVAEYSKKKNVSFAAEWEQNPTRISALFFISGRNSAECVRVRKMTEAEACVGLLENSFALDPTDVIQAQQRLSWAAMMANAACTYALDYPRSYSCLPLLANAIQQQLDQVRPAAIE